MKKNWDNDVLICECHSDEHQILLFYNEEEYDNGHKYNMCYAHIHLITYKSFWRRLIHGIKYIFGYKSKYGAWDEFIFNPSDADKLQEVVNYLKEKQKKMRKLYLDDVRIPKTDGWDIVRSYDEFVKWITENGLPDVISFDHDLAHEHYSDNMYAGPEAYNKLYDKFEEKTGYDAAKWLCEYCWTNGLPIPEWNVHSANPVGSENIRSILTTYSNQLNDKN